MSTKRLSELVEVTDRGLYCPGGGFYVDPWRPVDRAVVTHGHADHATPGSKHYLCSTPGVAVLRQRLQPDAVIQGVPYGERTTINDVTVSLHPAGHLLGSAQVRLESGDEVTVITGDYKVAPDRTCEAFEPVACDTFITECTFGLPVYRWPKQEQVIAELEAWWRANQEAGRTSVVLAYALGKAQRVLSAVDDSIGPIVVHGAVERFVDVYREAGVRMPGVTTSTPESRKAAKGKGLVVAPPSVLGTAWLKRFSPVSLGFASGWMAIRGTRRRKAVDRGFVLSDHADWPGLLDTIKATGARRIGATHGYTATLTRYLAEQGYDAFEVPTRYVGEPESGESRDDASGGASGDASGGEDAES